ncbi:MAG: NUDIX hydrolase [Planctomycetes bacterium]|nr:NUDIX hydrolase [Planctomycetota bacterium]
MFNDQGKLRHAIVAVIEDGDEILFVERAARDTYPGYWSSVTGGMEPGETQQHAVVRECMEEVGLRVKPVRKLWESVTRRAHFVLHWWECTLDGPRDVTPDPSEVAAFKWLKFREIARIGLMFSDSRHFFSNIYPATRHRE